MAVLKNEEGVGIYAPAAASLLDKIVEAVDSKSPANINYVKARMLIEAERLPRKPMRELKMQVISYLKGEIRHPSDDERKSGKTNQVFFPDLTHARF